MLILYYFKFKAFTQIEIDISNSVVAKALLQLDNINKEQHFIKFFLEIISLIKINYNIYNKQLLIVIKGLYF